MAVRRSSFRAPWATCTICSSDIRSGTAVEVAVSAGQAWFCASWREKGTSSRLPARVREPWMPCQSMAWETKRRLARRPFETDPSQVPGMRLDRRDQWWPTGTKTTHGKRVTEKRNKPFEPSKSAPPGPGAARAPAGSPCVFRMRKCTLFPCIHCSSWPAKSPVARSLIPAQLQPQPSLLQPRKQGCPCRP